MPRPYRASTALVLAVLLGGCLASPEGPPSPYAGVAVPSVEEAQQALGHAGASAESPLSAAFRTLLLVQAEDVERQLAAARAAPGNDAPTTPEVASPAKWRDATQECLDRMREAATSPWPAAWRWRSSVDCRANAHFLHAFARGGDAAAYETFAHQRDLDAARLAETASLLVEAARTCDACNPFLLAAAQAAAVDLEARAARLPPPDGDPTVRAILAAERAALAQVVDETLAAARRAEGYPVPPPPSPRDGLGTALAALASHRVTWGTVLARSVGNGDACAQRGWMECAAVERHALRASEDGALAAASLRGLDLATYAEAAGNASARQDPFLRDLRLTEAWRSLSLHADEPGRVLHSYGVLAAS